jgi:hypothetical protein
MVTYTIRESRKYDQFDIQESDNRELKVYKHKNLERSMRRYGFLPCFPIVVIRKHGKNVVKDGQHRFAIAQKLDIPFYYVETEEDFDTAAVNCTSLGWQLEDYAKRHLEDGREDYGEALTFAEKHSLSLGLAASLLAGVTSISQCKDDFVAGTWKVADRPWAEQVASLYRAMLQLGPKLNGQRFLSACMAVCRVRGFKADRLLAGASRPVTRKKLICYGDRDGYLDLLQELYNYGQKQLVALKVDAINAMRERSARHNDAVRAKGRARSLEARTGKGNGPTKAEGAA